MEPKSVTEDDGAGAESVLVLAVENDGAAAAGGVPSATCVVAVVGGDVVPVTLGGVSAATAGESDGSVKPVEVFGGLVYALDGGVKLPADGGVKLAVVEGTVRPALVGFDSAGFEPVDPIA